MKLSEIKNHLKELKTIAFKLPNGDLVPRHFHVTEVGKSTKDFIDCGGTIRHEELVNFQLWEENDYDHRLHPDKLLNIIELSESKLGIPDLDIEVEYQGDTIGKYDLDFDGENFLLITKNTNCLAKDQCVPPAKKSFQILEMADGGTCTPGGGCC